MGDIIIKQTQPVTQTYHIKNLNDLEISQDMPSFVYPIPITPDTGAIGLKIEGNTSTITVTWTLTDENSTVVDELTGDDAVETADEQMVFLMGGGYLNNENTGNSVIPPNNSPEQNTSYPKRIDGYTEKNGVVSFQPTDTGAKYEFQILPPTGSTPFFSRTGIISRLSISKSGEAPVTYDATITFLVADMQLPNS